MHKEQIIIDGVEVLKEKINMCFILLLNKLETPETIEQTIYEHLDAFVKEWNAQLARKTQIIDDVEEVIKPYQEQIELDAFSLPIAIESILERKTQECEKLKKQLMQKSEVDMFFNTPIEGWSNDPCGICPHKAENEELKKEIINKNEKIKELRFSVSDLTNRLCYLNAEKSFRIVDLESSTKQRTARMITVSILINGQPLYTRSAFRLEGKQGEVCKYKCDDGSIITHNYDDGAVELGHKLLNTIKELKR